MIFDSQQTNVKGGSKSTAMSERECFVNVDFDVVCSINVK